MLTIKHFFVFTSTFFTFLIIDFIWLTLIARNFYAKQIGFLLKPNVNYIAAIIFYLAFVFASLFLISFPLQDAPTTKLVLHAAVFGFITYATYDLTNLTTIKDWPLIVTIVDIFWGIFIGITTSLSGRFFIKLFFK